MTTHTVLSAFPLVIPVGEIFIALIVRLVVGYGLLTLAQYHLTHGKRPFAHDLQGLFSFHASSIVVLGALIEIALATLIVIGLYTQIAALLAMILCVKIIVFRKRFPHFGNESVQYYWAIGTLAFALALVGSGGYFSFDYPL